MNLLNQRFSSLVLSSQKILIVGLIGSCLSNINLPIQAQDCLPLSVVGGSGNEVEKTVTMTGIPPIFKHNWNTDWSIPNTSRFTRYRVVIVSEGGGNFNLKMYLKYSDGTADPFYEQNEVKLSSNNPLQVEITARRQEQPYQVNLLVGGMNSIGNKYRASVYACQ